MTNAMHDLGNALAQPLIDPIIAIDDNPTPFVGHHDYFSILLAVTPSV